MLFHFIHFMSVDSPVFNGELIRLVNEAMDGREHLFVINGKNTKEQLSQEYSNVIYESSYRLSTVKKYDNSSGILIFHSLFLSPFELCLLSEKRAKRIVWCVWGHDLYAKQKHTFGIGRFQSWLANRIVARFRAIVAGFKYDIHEIRRRYGVKVPVFNALYGSGYFQEDIDRIVQNHCRMDMRTNIMIGHSAFPFLQHLEQLDRLSSYKEENIVITLVLSYGDNEYANKVIGYATDIFGIDKLNVIRNFMTWDQYIEMLCDVDIAIFDFDHQAAFGNLILLSYLEKKLYLSSVGVMYRALQAEGVEVYRCAEIGWVTFEELKANAQSKNDISYSKDLLNQEKIINQWKQLFQTVR